MMSTPIINGRFPTIRSLQLHIPVDKENANWYQEWNEKNLIRNLRSCILTDRSPY